jgi:ABC-type multidrug transport system fused ATPase/permease subunit
MSTLSTCDRVLVLADGEVEGFGPSAELERTNAFYRLTTALFNGAV